MQKLILKLLSGDVTPATACMHDLCVAVCLLLLLLLVVVVGVVGVGSR